MTENTSAPEPAEVSSRWDFLAMLLSAACIVHCLGLPFVSLLAISSLVAFEGEFVHRVLLALALPLTLWVLIRSRAMSEDRVFVVLAIAGLGLMLCAVVVPTLAPFETPMTVVGGLLLATAHGSRWFRQQARQQARRQARQQRAAEPTLRRDEP